jgi:hypothetical protein
MKIRIHKNCTEEKNNRFWREGFREVDDETGKRLIAQGKAVSLETSNTSNNDPSMGNQGKTEGNESSEQGSGQNNDLTAMDIPLPEGFPAGDKLIAGGIQTVQQLKAASRKDIEKIPEITKAEVIKIGMAADKL